MMEFFKSASFGKDFFSGQNEIDYKSRHITDHNSNVIGHSQIDKYRVNDIIYRRRDSAYDKEFAYHISLLLLKMKRLTILTDKMALRALLVVAHDPKLAKSLEIFDMQSMLSFGKHYLLFAFGKWSILGILHHLFAIDF